MNTKPPKYSAEISDAQKVVCQDDDAPKTEEPNFPVEINLELPPTATCYLPLPIDAKPPVGTIPGVPVSKMDYSPMVQITDVRPRPDRFSVKRYSPNEWRAVNQEVIDLSSKVNKFTSTNILNTKNAVLTLLDLTDKAEKNSTEALTLRLREVGKWKTALETAIANFQEEIVTMESERVRLKQSLVIIGTPLSISEECLMIRSCRPETELVRDVVDEALLKEVEMLQDIRALLNKTLSDFEYQQTLNRAARERLDFDWSDKAMAYYVDLQGAKSNKNSRTIMFSPGSVKAPAGQSSEACWRQFSEGTMQECEQVRTASINLRATLDSILLNAAKDIEASAQQVEKNFLSHIKCLEETERRLMQELNNCINNLVETENRAKYLQSIMHQFDGSMKLVQTRLASRGTRCNVENCRDKAQQRLIDEVIANQDGVEGVQRVLEEAEKAKQDLIDLRVRLEHDIMLKRKSLYLDRSRCMQLRAHFPSASSLKGAAA